MESKTILIADDQMEVTRLIVSILSEQESKIRMINANNGEIACKVAQEQLPDLIIMDWNMPVMNGIEATRRLKKNEATFDIPIIIATGQMTSPEDLRIALEAGAVDYIRKPIDKVELIARVNTAMRIRDQYRSIQDLMQSEIELKNRKLSTTSMLIVEKNSLLHDFLNEIESIEKKITSEPEKAELNIKNLKKRIYSQMDIDNSWDTFKLHFDEVHTGFFSLLSSRYPGLSHKDLKLCAYVKLGMDNKQIAQLLNITYSSIRTALTRLKRKLDLDEENHLRSYLSELDINN